MTTIDSSLIDQLGLGGNQSSRKPSNKLGQEDFLKLMTTQLKNQDPTKPMDNSAFLGQIAQFSSVTGIQEMQASVKQLVETLSSNQTMQAASLVGKTVVASADSALYDGEHAIQGGVELTTAADNVVVGIFDQSGQLVKKLELGAQGSGTVSFNWDGLATDGSALPAGAYRLKAESIVDGKATAVSTLVAEPIVAVNMASGGKSLSLTLAGGSDINMSDVKQIM
ncbi:MAG: flagellar hook assembly protein FlgD [Pseudomonadota bacterium]